MKVSIVMPCRDAEPFLAEAVASVRGQRGVDWELLVVDDGSTDRSRAVACEEAARDPRIRVLGTTDGRRGAAAARNVGLEHADGELVTFLDADDLLVPDGLTHRCEALRDHPRAMATYGPTRWWHPDRPQLDWTERMRGVGGRLHQPPELLTKVVLLNRSDVPCTCGVMARREAIEVVGGFDESFYLYEDQTLWVKLFLRYPVYVDTRVAAVYRRHPGARTHRPTGSGAFGAPRRSSPRENFLDWVESYADGQGRLDATVARSLRIARRRAGATEPRTISRSERFAAGCLSVEARVVGQAARIRRLRRRVELSVHRPKVPSR